MALKFKRMVRKRYVPEHKMVLVDADLLVELMEQQKGRDFTMQWGDPITEVVTYYTPTITVRERRTRRK